MDHTQAVQAQAVDRYLLGELAGQEREEFEQHFFLCAHCSEELRDGAVFVDNARVVLREESAAPKVISLARTGARHGGYWLKAAVAALTCLAGYQNLMVLPRYKMELAANREIGSVAEFTLNQGQVRGPGQNTVEVEAGARMYMLQFELLPLPAGYRWRLEDGSGKVVLPAKDLLLKGAMAHVPLWADETPDGDYVLVVLKASADQEVVGRYPFVVQHKKGT